MELANLRDLYLHELRDLYSAEQQLIAALPRLADHASHPNLRRVFACDRHLNSLAERVINVRAR